MDFVKDLDNRLLFAIPKKGRLYEQCLNLLHGSDLQFNRKNRLDIALVTNLPVALIFLPAADIPKYVAEGNIDMGITGQDMIAENEAVDAVEEILELGFGKCSLCVQVPVNGQNQTLESLVGRRVVTSFEVLAKKVFEPLDKTAGKTTKISYVAGSVEAACALGLADGISKFRQNSASHKPFVIHQANLLLPLPAIYFR
jgi:ATP phosphoribosyltransferase